MVVTILLYDHCARAASSAMDAGYAYERGPGQISIEQSAIDTVVHAARALYPGIRAATVQDIRIGERPIPRDGLPVLGRAAELPNFHFAVSHSGITLALHAGDLVAAEVLGEDRNDALAGFRYDRF